MTQETITSLGTDMASLSPAMRQYRAAKDAHPDTLLFFRMGDFYELFFEDAIVAARELQLTLTARDKAKSVPMCGVPYHAAETYLQRLLRKGFRVAICEQMEDPKQAKGVVKREVTRVLTPGTAIDPPSEPSRATTSPASPSPAQAPRPSADSRCSTSPPASSAQPSSAAQPHGRRWPTSSAAYARSSCSTEPACSAA